MNAHILPNIIFGTSALGNLYKDPGFEQKCSVVEQIINHGNSPLYFDTAGKYGAGLALESLGRALKSLNVAPSDVVISNKLGWKRVPLTAAEPTFEPGAWVNLEYDAEQCISYDGILECFHQGNELLGDYNSRVVSLHDPDEYLAKANGEKDLKNRKENVLSAYQALSELKSSGLVDSIGVGSKDADTLAFVADNIDLDWAMFACSFTPYSHPEKVKESMQRFSEKGIKIINSAVFHGGFLIGSDYFDYAKVSRNSHQKLYQWRDLFFECCQEFSVDPALVCVQFSFKYSPAISVALNTSSPERVAYNLQLVRQTIPEAFWQKLSHCGLITV